MSIKHLIQRIALTTLAAFAGQNAAGIEGPPELPMYDQVGVNLSSGYATIMLEDLSIGSGVSALNHSIANHENFFWGFKDEFSGQVKIANIPGHALREVQLGHSSQTFRLLGGALSPLNKNGSKLVNHGNGTYTYTTRDGTVALIDAAHGPLKITKPNGYEYTIHRKSGRIQSVTTNTGLQLKYKYRRNTLPSNATSDHVSEFSHPVSIVAINNAVEYCSPTADSCAHSSAWPKVTYQWPTFKQMFGTTHVPSTHLRGIFKVTDAGGRETRYTHRPHSVGLYGEHIYEPRIIEIKSDTSSSVGTSTFQYEHYQQCVRSGGGWNCSVLNSNVVAKSKIGSAEWTYNYPKADTPYVSGTNYSYGPHGTAHVTIDRYGAQGGPSTFVSANGHTVRHKADDTRHITRVDYPEGYYATFTYDSRGNLIQRKDHGDEVLTSSATYESGCVSKKTCNQPLSITDARGNTTHFAYDSSSGQIARKTLPAVKEVNPETRYAYANRYAYYKNASGNYVRANTPVRLLVKESYCATGNVNAAGTGCALDDEVITRYEYGPTNSGPNNLWLRGVAITADGQTRRTCYQYDNVGNKIAETQPKANRASCN